MGCLWMLKKKSALDRHLITLDEDCRLVVSRNIRDFATQATIPENFLQYEGKPIELPERFLPDQRFLGVHREEFGHAEG